MSERRIWRAFGLPLVVVVGARARLHPRTAEAQPAPAPRPLDEVVLRDGLRLHGRVVAQQPGQFVVIDTSDGRRRSLSPTVVTEVNLAPGSAARLSRPDAATRATGWDESSREAWRMRGGSALNYEVRAQLTGVVFPTEEYRAVGTCATGTGVAPLSIYGRKGTGQGGGGGAGLGVRGGYMFMSLPPPESGSSWWALHAGAGLDLDVLYEQRPVGMLAVDGEPCAEAENRPPAVRHESATSLLARIPIRLGTQVGLGGFGDARTWRGVSLGIAWSPSLTYLSSPWGEPSLSFSYRGGELTLDLATLHARSDTQPRQAHLRVATFVLAPVAETDPLIATMSIGVVWY